MKPLLVRGNQDPGRIPAAPRNVFLPLLPFGPGGVRRVLPRRACPDVCKDTRRPELCQPQFCARVVFSGYPVFWRMRTAKKPRKASRSPSFLIARFATNSADDLNASMIDQNVLLVKQVP